MDSFLYPNFFCNFAVCNQDIKLNMNILFLTQFASFVVSGMLALFLILTRFQIRWPNHRYEVSRWLMCGAMLALTFHFVLQMAFDIRAKSDAVGAVVNILFYAPIEYLMTCATFNLICYRSGRKRVGLFCSLSYALIIICFLMGFIGVVPKGSMHIGFWLYLMLTIFTLTIIYCIIVTFREMQHHRKILLDNTAEDLLPFDSFASMSYVSMGICCLGLMAGIISRPILLVIAPLVLLSVVVFIVSFVGYGFNIMPLDNMLERQIEEETEEETEEEKPAEDEEEVDECLTPESIAKIEKLLAEWCKNGGFRDSAMNMPMLASMICVNRKDLSAYFEDYLQSSFRVWLSDIRFQKAQSMLREETRYSNETVSIECGFSSHAHLYKVFRAKTGMTPIQWRRFMAKKASENSFIPTNETPI